MGSLTSKISKQPLATGVPCRRVEGEAASPTGRADESWKYGLTKNEDLVAKSVDASLGVQGESVHDDASAIECGATR